MADAETAILSATRRHLGAIITLSEGEPAVRNRGSALLHRLEREVHLAQAVFSLSPAQQEKLRTLRSAQPEVLYNALSSDPGERLGAMRLVRSQQDPCGLTEPLVILNLRHDRPEVRLEAARAAASPCYQSESLVQALAWVIARVPAADWDKGPWNGRGAPEAASAAASALEGKPRALAAAAIIGVLRRAEGRVVYRDVVLAEALTRIGEIRCVPMLVDILRSASQEDQYTVQEGGFEAGIASSDAVLLSLIHLTAQDPRAYGFAMQRSVLWHSYGFTGPERRARALKQFYGWWSTDPKARPYRTLRPLDVARVPCSRPESAKAPSSAGGPAPPRPGAGNAGSVAPPPD